ncbi:Alpha/beta hydrolase family-domain-containing protein [Mycena albidolilacea]|uniref:Alpha/beta hydrolase family-domain-containing protein n=1 Tax=Mycena albidolilacea TaxID=1033008 RepID=A0AAD7A329_9AGAR|nr:Alpha/beta hydrolase family-domain-containing protein [Mycena albidolilacea]
MLLPALLALHLLSTYVTASSASCGCSSLAIPVHVDVLVPTDPTDAFAGLKSNASSLRRVDDTYDIYGVFCQPDTASVKNTDVLQILVHGFTYTSEYWSPPVEEFRNYSYAAFSCDRGLSTLAIDWLGVGLSSRPENASDVQYPTVAASLSQIARHLKNASILPGIPPFKKIIGIGHSAGSAILTFGAIVEGAKSPFDGLILTSSLILTPETLPTLPLPSARDENPLRWGTLDPGYVTTTDDRSIFYPVDPTAFSPRMLIFDTFTKDVASVSTFVQLATSSLEAQYTGPVVKVLGTEDQLICGATGRCDDLVALTASEGVLWPAAQSFDIVAIPGSGHVMTLDFFAQGAFNVFVGLVNKFSGL